MAAIIKAAEQHQTGVIPPLQAYHFDDVGSVYLSRVRSEAARLITEAKTQAAQIKAQAKKEGQQAAIDEVQKAFKDRLDQQLASTLSALGEAAKQISQSRQAWQQHWQQNAVALAAGMAKRICRQELTKQPEISAKWIQEALALAAGNGSIVLRLHPEDAKTFAAQVDAIKSRLAGIGQVQVTSDASISRGGCRVETDFGSLDQQLETQLDRLSQELLD